MKPSLELVGDWTSPRLLIRLMIATDSPWQLTDRGLQSRETGDLCRLEMRGPDLKLAAKIREGDSPTAPSITEEIALAVETHKSVLRVVPLDSSGDDALVALARCGAGLANAGAIALLCPQSGASCGADRWIALVEEIEAEIDTPSKRERLASAFVRPLVRAGDRWRSLGMGLLGCPDVAVPGSLPDAVALDLLSKTCARLTRGDLPSESEPVWTSAKHRAGEGASPGRFVREDDPPGTETFNPSGLFALSLP